jgi:hypothetical protein
MSSISDKEVQFLRQPIGAWPRLSLVVLTGLMLVLYLLPLWKLTMFAPQYAHGLELDIFNHGFVGGHGGQDVKEINLLNHYIGMHPLETSSFAEFAWLPFALGGVGLLLLRAAALGTVKDVVDAFAVFIYVSAFSLWSFANRLYSYGHELAPDAAVKVQPFMPPLFGHQRIANFDVYSYPRPGSYVMAAVALGLLLIIISAWRQRPAAGAA